MFERIIIIDDDARRRATLAAMMTGAGYHVEPFEGIGEYRSYPIPGALYLASFKPGLAEEVIKLNAIQGVDAPFILYSHEPNADDIVDSIAAGANYFLRYPFCVETLHARIDASLRTCSQQNRLRIKMITARDKLDILSAREREVLSLIADGHSSKMVGLELRISHRTVEIHRANIMSKLRVSSSAEMVRIAVESTLDEFGEAAWHASRTDGAGPAALRKAG